MVVYRQCWPGPPGHLPSMLSRGGECREATRAGSVLLAHNPEVASGSAVLGGITAGLGLENQVPACVPASPGNPTRKGGGKGRECPPSRRILGSQSARPKADPKRKTKLR